jgi:hypothetical protein
VSSSEAASSQEAETTRKSVRGNRFDDVLLNLSNLDGNDVGMEDVSLSASCSSRSESNRRNASLKSNSSS